MVGFESKTTQNMVCGCELEPLPGENSFSTELDLYCEQIFVVRFIC